MADVSKRLASLDILRGIDLFFLIILGPFLHAFNRTGEYGWMEPVMKQMSHVGWEGFACWDIVMPLFMFMTGVSIPFAFSKYLKSGEGYGWIYRRILRRVIVLWLLGMVCQGNLLALDLGTLKLFTNTLQAIAVGYFVSSLLYMHLNLRWQIIVSALLLIIYWWVMMFIRVDNYGGGNFTSGYNFAEWIDRAVLGHWRDGAVGGIDGSVVFANWYDYTWILSSLNFSVTVMTGVFAGRILKSGKSGMQKVWYLAVIGLGMVVAGWLWHLQIPVIKRIWTSSMVLVSSGYCFLLMSLFFYVIDYKGWSKGMGWLKIIGVNSIVAYILSTEVGIMHFDCIGHSLFYGIRQYTGDDFYHLLIVMSNLSIVYGILYLLYRSKCFIRI